MPFNPQYIDVANLNPNIGLGVNIPFNSSNIFTSTYVTQEAIKNNLINYFLTNPGEIPNNPTFGGGLRQFIFQQISEPSFDNIKSHMQNKISTVFPMVKITQLDVLSNLNEENSIIIDLKYSLTNTNSTGSLTFNFNA
jgi:phage baseplate assembly protein W